MITLTRDGDVAEIVLDAPSKLNALDLAGVEELDAAFREAAGARALVLRGEGRAFCAGRDISGVDPATDDVPGYLGMVEALMRRISGFAAPTFAAVQGACLGVGIGLAIATDVVYVADDAKIGSPFAGLGAVLDSGGHALLFERLGAHRAFDLIYTGELMSGADAVAAGLFSRSMPARAPGVHARARGACRRGADRSVPRVQARDRATARRAPVGCRARRDPRAGCVAPHPRLRRGLRVLP